MKVMKQWTRMPNVGESPLGDLQSGLDGRPCCPGLAVGCAVRMSVQVYRVEVYCSDVSSCD